MADIGWTAQQEVRRSFTIVSWHKRFIPYIVPAFFAGAVILMAVAAFI